MADPDQGCVALYTFGLLKAPLGSEELCEFAVISPSVFGEAEASEGFIANAAADRPDLKGQAGLGADYGPWVWAPPFLHGR